MINVRHAISTFAKVWTSLPYTLFCVFIWLFFSLSVDTFGIPFSIFSVTPNSGNSVEETVIVIEGLGFDPKAKVLLNNKEIPSIFINSRLIIASVPKLEPDVQAGYRDITIVNPNGDKSTLSEGFEYTIPLSIEKIEPPGGPPEGGTPIIITGNGFKETTVVTIGEAVLLDKQLLGTTTIIGKTPPGKEGFQDVVVTNDDLQVVKSLGFLYTTDLLTTERIEPIGGNPNGNTYITISGTGFLDGAIVTIGGKKANNIRVLSTTTITAMTPSGDIGSQQVFVTNPDGQSSSQEIFFTYRPPPSIDSISPPSGKLAGGTAIIITGTGFIEQILDQRISVKIGEVDIKDVEFSKTQLAVGTPARIGPGDVSVTVINPDKQKAQGKFMYNPLPIITNISPPSGKLAGGTKITIAGDYFINQIPGVEGIISVTIGGVDVKDVKFISATQLTMTTPERESGLVNVIVTNPDGQGAETTFTYNPFPAISEISPPSGNPNVITLITIMGENFIESIPDMPNRIQVSIGGIQIVDEDVQFLSSDKLRIHAPKSQPGAARIVVTNPDGQSSEENISYIYNSPPKITSILPESGTVGTKVTLIGENFIPNILVDKFLRVTIGGTQIDDIRLVQSNEIQFIAPDIGLLGSVPVIVINPDGQQSRALVNFTYIPRPIVQTISPVSGSLSGGTKITIRGSGFVEKIGEQWIQVEFEGISVVPNTDVKFIASNELEVTTPENPTPGTINVIVTNPDGRSSEKYSDAMFMYNPLPEIEDILPRSGKLEGGTEITITGKNFIRTISGEEREFTVTIGGIAAKSILFVSNQNLRVTIPPRPEPGQVEVIVTNPDGQESKSDFTYNPPPTVTNISPPSGKLAGGTEITITGTGFINKILGSEEELTITIGGADAENVQFSSETQLNATIPGRYQSGDVNVIITNPDGQYAIGTFTYNGIPTITSISPESGKLAGGTEITIIGSGFIQEIPGGEGTLTVTIGGVNAKNVKFSKTKLTMTTPEHEPGEVDVIITNPDEQQAKGKFTYNHFPTISKVSPSSGNPNLITPLIITGENFIEYISGMKNRIQVDVGEIQLVDEDIQFLSPNKLRIFAPKSQPGNSARIVVTNPDGQSSQEGEMYTYNPIPKVTNISPKRGPVGTRITIIGKDFIPNILNESLRVTIGGTSVEDIQSVTSNEIQFIAPDTEIFGSAPVIVINPDGQQAKTTFTYIPHPTVWSISPISGSLIGGTKIVIEGTGFVERIGEQSIQVEFEGISVVAGERVEFISSERLRVPTPESKLPGKIYVAVINPDGQSSQKSEDAIFTYNPLPKIENITPKSGALAGGTEITITGEHFIQEIPGEERQLTVMIDGIPAISVSFISNQELLITTPSHSEPGKVKLIVTNPDGQKTQGAFTYNLPPTITNISPPSGKLSGGTKITITGTEFTKQILDYEETINVTIDGIAVNDVQFISDTQLIIISPEHEPGEIDIVVTNPDGQYTKGNFIYNPLPEITNTSPPSGKLEGGTQITITGTGFINQISGVEEKLTVTVGGVDAKDVKFISETQLTLTTPERTESGKVNVIVTNPDEQYAEATFTYNPFPMISEISLPSGNPNVITSVTIKGENFIESISGMPNRIQVQIGKVQIVDKDIQFLSPNELRIFAPKSDPGIAPIVVANPDEQSSKETVVYIYNPPPKVMSISPGSGTIGTEIILKGEKFIPKILDKSLRITVGGIPVDKIGLVKSNEIQFTAPKIDLLGPAPVIVTNPDEQQSESTVTFTYIPGPAVRKISPSSGRLAESTKITIKGANFIKQIGEQRIQVKFEGISVVPDVDVDFISSEELKVTTLKNQIPGRVYIIVTNPDGQSSEKSEEATFTYNPRPQIESIFPESGKLDGGTEITITGENFIQEIPGEENQLTVTIGGTAAKSVFFTSNQKLFATTPARPESGDFQVVVINPDGQEATGMFTYNPFPVVDSITPDRGIAGTFVTISGSNFIERISDQYIRLKIGDVSVEKINFVSSEEITFTAPAHVVGSFRVIVINPDGQEFQQIINFTYNPVPTITDILPPRGRLDGGTEIILQGSGFICEAITTPEQETPKQIQVKIGNKSVEIDGCSPTELRFTTPANSEPGDVDITVTNPDGQEVKGTYTYNELLTVTGISPPSGKLAGGTKVTITGTGFIGQILNEHLSIQIGNIDATANIEFILPTQIVLTTPTSNAPKEVDVIITNPDGQKTPSTQFTEFTYNPFPVVDSITPDRGIAGTFVTISGSNFIERISDQYIRLKIGDVSVEKINFVSSEEITFTAPAHVVGSFRVIVINPDGQEFQQIINFTYNPVPTITDILPPRGRLDGGTEIILQGSGFICEAITTPEQETPKQIQVKIGNKSVEIDGCSPTELRFTTPSSSKSGEVDVIVINSDGQQTKGKFTYISESIVLSVVPKVGNPVGDTPITIKGENFIECTEQSIKVEIGGREAQFITKLSDTEIIARTPSAETPDSVVDVIVISPDGQRSSEEVTFTYNDILSINDISPNIGSPTGGTEVTISGTGFTKEEDIPVKILFGDVAAGVFEVVSPTQLIILTPSGEPEAVVDVTIENDDRQEFTMPKGFRYTDRLVASKISPTIGPVNGGTEVVITGAGFIKEIGEQQIEVTFGGKPVNKIVSVEPTKLKILTPPGERNETSVEVVVTGPDGQESALVGRFHYIDFPGGVLVYNYPNPTPVGRGTTFRFSDSNGNVEIKIFNMAGVLVKSLPGNGGKTISWDGKDRFGNVARFGLYPYVYLVDGDVKQGQLLHIKPQR